MLNMTILYNRLIADILPFCEAVSIDEKLSGEFSELKLTLCNTDGRFTREWAAIKGDSVAFAYGSSPAENYSITSISINKFPRVVQWLCKARPVTTKAPIKRGKGSPPPADGAIIDAKRSWKTIATITFRDLLKKVCNECNLLSSYMPKENPVLSNVSRYRESGWAFLNRYAKCYGFGVRSTAESVTVFPLAIEKSGQKNDQKSIVIDDSVIKSFSIANEIEPASVSSARFDPRTKKIIKSKAGSGDGPEIDISSYDIIDADAVYNELSKQMRQIEIIPQSNIVTGAIVRYDDKPMIVDGVLYVRSADSEMMRLTLREPK